MRPVSDSRHFSRIAFCSFVSFVVSIFLGCAGPPKHPTWKNATGAEQYERLMWQAAHKKDWTNFKRQLAPAFVGIEPGGEAVDRDAWVQYWKSKAIGDYSMGEVAVQPAGPDLIITYVISFAGSPGMSGPQMRVLSVWQQVKSRMVLTASAVTSLRGEAPGSSATKPSLPQAHPF
ncbi:MAG: nuclear transport factor 2 family protein [Actinomycetota bacterium]